MICRISAAHKLPQGSFIRLAEPYSHSGEERKTRLRVCIFDAAGVKSAFALLLTKVTKPSLGNLLICAVSGTITDKKEVYAYIGKGG